jgi:hypothetical protein
MSCAQVAPQQDIDVVLSALMSSAPAGPTEEVRALIMQGLPHALAVSDGAQRHAFQDEFASHARGVLVDMHRISAEAESAASDSTSQATAACSAAEKCIEESAAVVEALRATAAQCSNVLEEAWSACKTAEAEQAASEQNNRAISDVMAQLRDQHERTASMFERSFKPLREGVCADDELKATSVQVVKDYLAWRGDVEKPLVAAAPFALQSCPSDRGDFDNIVVDALAKLFEADVATTQAALAAEEPNEQQISAEALGSWALADHLRDQSKFRATEHAESLSAVRREEGTHAKARAHAKECEEFLARCVLEQNECAARTRALVVALEAFDRLTAGTVVDSADKAMDGTSEAAAATSLAMQVCKAVHAPIVEAAQLGA